MTEDTTILIAEDDAGHFALVKKNLWRTCVNNDILHFRNGQEILDYVFLRTENPEKMISNRRYVLLLDIRMPKIDGYEVLLKMKADPELCKIPIIMLTTTEDPKEIRNCYSAGCSFYIVKPSDYNDFMSSIEFLGNFLSLNGVSIPKINTDAVGR